MSDISNPLAWVERAEEDYLMTQSALRRKRPLTYSACFHAQQCTDKYLKAILSVLKKLFYRGEREERREKLKNRFKNSY